MSDEKDAGDALHAEVLYPTSRPLVWRDRDRVSGALCLAGTRIPLDILVAYLQEGATIDDFLASYPSVTPEQAVAVLDLMLRLIEDATPLEGRGQTIVGDLGFPPEEAEQTGRERVLALSSPAAQRRRLLRRFPVQVRAALAGQDDLGPGWRAGAAEDIRRLFSRDRGPDAPAAKRPEDRSGATTEGRRIVVEETHRCPEMEETERLRGRMEAAAAERNHGPEELLYGPAITRIDRAGGAWWAHNDEYSVPVRYCPWCGRRLDQHREGG